MKAYEKYINQALLDLIDKEIAKNGQIDQAFKNDIPTMGASIIQSGLIPTLAVYSEQGSDPDRSKILVIIQQILNKNQPLFQEAIQHKNNPPALRKLQRDILNALTALKLAVLTFKISK